MSTRSLNASMQSLSYTMSLPVCDINILLSNMSSDRLSIRVERGSKPRLKLSDDKRTLQVLVPLDCSQNWPSMSSDLHSGYKCLLEKKQQQWKISIQHQHQRKPEFVVYSASLPHEKEVKTSIKEMNTLLEQISIAGPNLEVSGHLKAQRLILESSVGTMHVYAKAVVEHLTLRAQNLVIASEALLSSDRIRLTCRRVQIDGKLYPYHEDSLPGPSQPRPRISPRCSLATPPSSPSSLSHTRMQRVSIDASLCHIGVDGAIGDSNEKEKKDARKKCATQVHVLADELTLEVTGSLANYGRVTASHIVQIYVNESLLSLSDGSLDSASRGYSALKQIRGVGSSPPDRKKEKIDLASPSSGSLRAAITSQNTGAVASLIEQGVDLNDKVGNFSRRLTLRQAAILKYKQARAESTLNKTREKITLINALFSVHDWRRGAISAKTVFARFDGDCLDCAQLTAERLGLQVHGHAEVEADSIWTCGIVEADVGKSVRIEGQVKHSTLVLNAGTDVFTTADGIVAVETVSKLSCRTFDSSGVWSVGGAFVAETREDAIFRNSAYLECEKIESVIGSYLAVDGTWQTADAYLLVEKDWSVGAAGKLFIESSLTANCLALGMHGVVNAGGEVDIQCKADSRLGETARVEAHGCKLVCSSSLSLLGHLSSRTLRLFTRHALHTSAAGRVLCYGDAHVTCGVWRSEGWWQVERELTLVAGSLCQSPTATLFCKATARLDVLGEGGDCGGRLVANKLAIKCLHAVVVSAHVKVNEMEVCLPYMDQSRLSLRGQTDVLVGALIAKGNSSPGKSDRKAHHFPGLIIEGELIALAILAPFIAVELACDSTTRVFGVKADYDAEFNMLVSCAALRTRRGSSLLSLSECEPGEGVVCAGVWRHDGAARFGSNHVFLLTGSLLHSGRLTSSPSKQNELAECEMLVDAVFLNQGVLAAKRLTIEGEAILENKNRIYAVEHLDIRLRNFHNDEGLIESRNSMRLLAAGREWTHVGGDIRARTDIEMCANRLNLAIKPPGATSPARLRFSAASALLLSSPLSDPLLNLACAASHSITFSADCASASLEILLGTPPLAPPPLHGAVLESAASVVRITDAVAVRCGRLVLNVQSECPCRVDVVIDGSVECEELLVGEGVREVRVSGRGSLRCQRLVAPTMHVELARWNIKQMECPHIVIPSGSLPRWTGVEQKGQMTVLCDRLSLHGTLFVDDRLFMTGQDGSDVCVDGGGQGGIVGSSPACEVSIEASSISLAAQLANIKFLELYAKDALSIAETACIKNIASVVLECGSLWWGGRVSACGDIIANAETAHITAIIQGNCSSGVVSVNATTLCVGGTMCELERVEVRGASVALSTTLTATHVHADCKWLTIDTHIRAHTLSIKAHALLLRSVCSFSTCSIECLGVMLLTGSLEGKAVFTAPFIVAPGTLPSDCDVTALVAFCCSPLSSSNVYLWMDGSGVGEAMSARDGEHWSEIAALVKDRFPSHSVDPVETLLAVKYLADLHPVRARLPPAATTDIHNMIEKVSSQHLSLFHPPLFARLLASLRRKVPVDTTAKSTVGKRKPDCRLYESLVQFKNATTCGERRCPSDAADGGYASRSSSEDLDKEGRRVSPGLPSPPSAFPPHHLTLLCEELNEVIRDPLSPRSEHSLASPALTEREGTQSPLVRLDEASDEEVEEEEDENVAMDYIVCGGVRVALPRLKEQQAAVTPVRPRINFPLERTPSSNDLVLKRIQVQRTLSSLSLNQFGSSTSLCSEMSSFEPGSPMQFAPSPFQRSRIPRCSFRRPTTPLK